LFAYSREYIGDVLMRIKKAAAQHWEQQRENDPASFVILCRAQIYASSRHILAYRPIREILPEEMRAIDAWK